jgi:hypothetical protein
MRLTDLETESDAILLEHNMMLRDHVVRPYHRYLSELGKFLEADGNLKASVEKAVSASVQRADDPNHITAKDIVLPQAVTKNFAASLPQADAGPVSGFEQKVSAIADKVQNPEIKNSILSKIKYGIQHPAAQTLILAGVSNVVGMSAGALTMGLGAGPAKAAASAVGTGLLNTINAKLAGETWKSAVKAGMHGAAQGAATSVAKGGDIAVEPGKVPGAKDAAAKPPATAGTGAQPPEDKQAITAQWEKFVQFGQDLIKKMGDAQPAPAKT